MYSLNKIKFILIKITLSMEEQFQHLNLNLNSQEKELFLSEEKFLEHFNKPLNTSKQELPNILKITYSPEVTLNEAFFLEHPNKRKPIIKSPQDYRYVNKEKIIDYFYNVLILQREKYLKDIYKAYFKYEHPDNLNWEKEVKINDESISTQKNDKSKTLIRNIFYLNLLYTTTLTNSAKPKVSFWQSLLNLFNHYKLEDRFFAPSCVEQYIKEKKSMSPYEVNFKTLFYLFQQYQPKASILNPYTIHYILTKELNLEENFNFFTPVLSWGSYLVAFMETNGANYVGVDVMPSVCKKVKMLSDWYSRKNTDIILSPSEKLLKNKNFLKKYTNFFHVVMVCPPYWKMEEYHEGEQSTDTYKTYETWLTEYWENTVKLCKIVLKQNGYFCYIANDYSDLKKNEYFLTKDFQTITMKYFTLFKQYKLVNRVSPERINKKDRTEKLFIMKNN
jgi:hypothetical protein